MQTLDISITKQHLHPCLNCGKQNANKMGLVHASLISEKLLTLLTGCHHGKVENALKDKW